MDPIERLNALFVKFPGIGPRQAQRFVHYLLRSSPAVRRELSDALRELGSSVKECPRCFRFHSGDQELCSICGNPNRSDAQLAVVSNDADLAALERSNTYRGRYFVLGGTISLASEKANGLRVRELIRSLPGRAQAGLKEVILAFPANPEGDATVEYLKADLAAFGAENAVAVSALGRGLSTGSELEYADADTLKSALENRR
jgi:recombination protein RecR